ncbi:unnamed protein product [Camellia sinensis]
MVAENEDEGGGGDVMGSGDQRSEEASTVVGDRRLEAVREIGLQINHEENADRCFLEVQYLHDYAGISTRIGLTANPIVNFSGVLGSNVVALGTDISFDTKTGEFTKCNVGLSFSNADLIASLTLGNDLKPIDCLTEMPDDILSFILSFLSIRDSVKARILSRRWRYICPFMLNLDFDLHIMLGINYKARYSNGDLDISWEDKSKFVTRVDQFLELYNGQKLLSLKICFCLGNEYSGYVDSLRPTPNLVSRLVSLKSLDLQHVPLNQSCANSILSSCLNLEWLRLKNSILPETLCIHGPSHHLKILIVHECYGVEKFEISSIGLITFEYIGKVKNFSFLDVPRLEKVHIKFMVAYERGTQYMFNGIANDLPWLQTLSLVLTTDEVLLIPARITRFNSLKQLELFVMLHTGRSRGRRIEQQYSKHVHCELKEVEAHGFLGRSNEMELAIYLLKNAVSERMILSTQKRLYHGGGKWTSSRCPWFEWHRKKACAYDLLQKEKVNSHTKLPFL